MSPLALFVPYLLSLCCIVVHSSSEISQHELVDAIGLNSSSQGGTKQCIVAGDPHVWSFCGTRFDPMHGTGHWWLVKTADQKVMIQGTYGGCGMKNGGGWQSSRLQGIPRTCLTSVGISGSFIKNKVLGIKSPCDWDWGNSKCRNNPVNNQPPIILVDGVVQKRNFADLIPGMKLTVQHNQVYFIGQGIWMRVNFGGRHWSKSANTYMNLNLKMPQPSGQQCGHCGPWDCSANVRNLYTPHGSLKPNQPEHCNADVSCDELYVRDTFSCHNNDLHAIDLTIDDCPQDHQAMSRLECKTAFQERNVDPSAGQMEECIADTCFGGDYFAKEDAKELERERVCNDKMWELEQNVQDAQWEVEDNEMFVEWDCPNGEPIPDVLSYDRVPRELYRVECRTRECPRAVSRYNSVAQSWKRRVRRLAMGMVKQKDQCDTAIRDLDAAREKLREAQAALEYCRG